MRKRHESSLLIWVILICALQVQQGDGFSSLGNGNRARASQAPTVYNRFANVIENNHNGANISTYFSRMKSTHSSVLLNMAKKSSEQIMARPWLPCTKLDDDIFAVDEKSQELEQKSIQYLASLMNHNMAASNGVSRLDDSDDCDRDGDIDGVGDPEQTSDRTLAMELAHDRFRDLTCSYEGELVLENVFDTRNAPDLEENDPDVIRGAVIALQSFLMLGMQVGVKGTPDQKKRSVDHLRSDKQHANSGDHIRSNLDRMWETYNARRLKHSSDITAGIQLLAEMKRKRNAQSAFDILVSLGAWTKHEDVALLRSGFSTRFTEDEEKAAMSAANDPRDPDAILGLRKDLRHLKAYTIDSESTDEIDDGLSIETIRKSDGREGRRIWVHIADADRWGESFKMLQGLFFLLPCTDD